MLRSFSRGRMRLEATTETLSDHKVLLESEYGEMGVEGCAPRETCEWDDRFPSREFMTCTCGQLFRFMGKTKTERNVPNF